RRSQAIKQPDVLMLIHLLWNAFPPEVREANFRHYDPRTAHGSSLSPSIHALLAARLGETALARRYWRQAPEIDLADNMGNAPHGGRDSPCRQRGKPVERRARRGARRTLPGHPLRLRLDRDPRRPEPTRPASAGRMGGHRFRVKMAWPTPPGRDRARRDALGR